MRTFGGANAPPDCNEPTPQEHEIARPPLVTLEQFATENVSTLDTLVENLTEFVENTQHYARHMTGLAMLFPDTQLPTWAGDEPPEYTTVLPKWITESVVHEIRLHVVGVAEIWVDFDIGFLMNWTDRLPAFAKAITHTYPIITVVTTDGRCAQLNRGGTADGYLHDRYISFSDIPPVDGAGIVRESFDIHDLNGILRGHRHDVTYDVVQRWGQRGRRRLLPYADLAIRGPLFLTTLLLQLTFRHDGSDAAYRPAGSYAFMVELNERLTHARLRRRSAIVEGRRRAVRKAAAVHRFRTGADGKDGSLFWAETMGDMYKISKRRPFGNYSECMDSTDYKTPEQLYFLARGIGLDPPTAEHCGDEQWRPALCRFLTDGRD